MRIGTCATAKNAVAKKADGSLKYWRASFVNRTRPKRLANSGARRRLYSENPSS